MTDYRFPLRDRFLARMRRSPVHEIKECLRLAEEHQIPVTARELEAHHLAGGRIMDVVVAMIYTREHGLDLSVRRARVQDLAYGKKVSVKDWVMDCQRRGVTNFEREPFERKAEGGK
jgi:uncharacterized protein YqfA (UPF0365 family)